MQSLAKFFPDTTTAKVIFSSSAEEILYTQFKLKLSKSWRVFYSIVLSRQESESGIVENEIDFLLYHPKFGVIALEVKGGLIGYDEARQAFTSKNRYGKTFSIKDPFKQAQHWKSRFIRFLRTQDIIAPVSYAVWFPDCSVKDFPERINVDRALLLGRGELESVEASLEKVAKSSHPAKFLNFEDVATKLTNILSGQDFQSKTNLRKYIDSHETDLALIEDFQRYFVDPIAAQRRVGIEGEAGTGKSLLCKELARKLSEQKQRVVVLSSNPILNVYYRENLPEDVQVLSYTDLAKRFGINFLTPDLDFKGTAEDWVQVEAPTRLVEKVKASDIRYDAVLCDEAQDVQPFWWDVVSALLHSLEESRLYVFFDRSQGIFADVGAEHYVPEKTLPVSPPYFPLINNYRMTKEICDFSSQFRTGTQVLSSKGSRDGLLPVVISYSSKEDALKKLENLLRSLVNADGVSPHEITLLSARRAQVEPSVIAEKKSLGGIPIYELGKTGKLFSEQMSQKNHLTVSTVGRFKGLETKVAILLNFSEYNLPLEHPLLSSLFYVAATRARHMLYIFLDENEAKCRVVKERLSSIKSTGSLTFKDEDHTLRDINKKDGTRGVGYIEHIDRRGFMTLRDTETNQVMIAFPASQLTEPLSVGSNVDFIVSFVSDLATAEVQGIVHSTNETTARVVKRIAN